MRDCAPLPTNIEFLRIKIFRDWLDLSDFWSEFLFAKCYSRLADMLWYKPTPNYFSELVTGCVSVYFPRFHVRSNNCYPTLAKMALTLLQNQCNVISACFEVTRGTTKYHIEFLPYVELSTCSLQSLIGSQGAHVASAFSFLLNKYSKMANVAKLRSCW